uniref:Uncharacterized protein n=1 Tax=viral metagenome TaxID=1070528 RepID=A0A6C0FES0_9ZZZZ|tara:strand:+ start:449 stop:1039 length:591 start_codon:yes stop_codon:yes gene_type:complete
MSKKLHHYGYTEEELNSKDTHTNYTIQERNFIYKNKDGTIRVNYNSPSDEFINEYIPEDLDAPVTWRDVLTMGMIQEQKTPDQTNRILRSDIQYNNIEIKYPSRKKIDKQTKDHVSRILSDMETLLQDSPRDKATYEEFVKARQSLTKVIASSKKNKSHKRKTHKRKTHKSKTHKNKSHKRKSCKFKSHKSRAGHI